MNHGFARNLAAPTATYRGTITTPERWETWQPKEGDVLVCTPPKCGTTWTQTMAAMLLKGTPDLGGRVSEISPWVDAALGTADAVSLSLSNQKGRRVVKTHTPANGFPIWEGVIVIAVYRHPLDVFFSLRKHALNMKDNPGNPMKKPVSEALAHFLSAPQDLNDFDRDSLATVALHYDETVLKKRYPNLVSFHYADMISDQVATVRSLVRAIGCTADEALISTVAEATGFETMRADAGKYVPEGGKGFWHDDAAFFDSGGVGKWHGKISEKDFELYEARLAELVPDDKARIWLEHGLKGA